MSLRIGDDAPDFTAETTEGPIRFHEWIGNSWAILFSHPKDFTPVCTTELGYMARLKPEFEKRNTKVIGLSIDPVTDHKRWANDIKETQGYAPNYPIIGDADLKVAQLYDMIHPNATAKGTTVNGASMLPRLGAVLMIPSAMARLRMGKYSADALTAAGVLTASKATSATRALTNWPTVAATACAMPARDHNATAAP